MSTINTLSTYDAVMAMQTLRYEMDIAEDYAWSWHCNIAMLLIDEGVGWLQANERAASFMQTAFDVDTLTRVRRTYAEMQALTKKSDSEHKARILEL